MWAEKRKRPGVSGNGPADGFALRKKPPKLAGTADIDALLAESDNADADEKEAEEYERQRKEMQEQEQRQRRRSGGCGCGG
jgi:hypothetical protein